MRALQHWGWINFRMRAMLVSVAAYHLWLDWRDLNQPLARQFIDYEPGIHISQLQMQSGVTGINALRIYNPVLQGQHLLDPKGSFIRTFVPELAPLRDDEIHQPWLLSTRRLAQAVLPARPGAPGAHGSSSLSPAPRGRGPGRPQCPRPHGGCPAPGGKPAGEPPRADRPRQPKKLGAKSPPQTKTAPREGPFQGELF